jgi:hypothetical protein
MIQRADAGTDASTLRPYANLGESKSRDAGDEERRHRSSHDLKATVE